MLKSETWLQNPHKSLVHYYLHSLSQKKKDMENHCVVVKFAVRKSKQSKQGLCPIEMSVSYNGERVYFSTSKQVKYSDWNKQKQQVKGSSQEAVLINTYLIELRNKIYEKEIELMKRGYMITVHLLKDAMLNKVESLKEKTLLQVIIEHNEEKQKLIGKCISPNTYYCFEHSKRLLQEFLKKIYKREDISLQETNIGFIQSFNTFLLTEKQLSQNTCSKHLKYLKSILNRAVSNGYIQYNAIANYRVEREPIDIDILTEEELRRIINFDTPIPRLEKAKDFFLFGCFTGLAYIDIKTLEPKHFEKDNSGRIWIKKKRVKTGVLSRIPLLPMAKMILEKYKGGNKLLPIQDASDINKYLKDIAIYCNIDKHITFHTSRHTFASTVTLANNISLEVVSKMLGHTNTRMTTHYAKLLDKYIGEQMDTLCDIYSEEK